MVTWAAVAAPLVMHMPDYMGAVAAIRYYACPASEKNSNVCKCKTLTQLVAKTTYTILPSG